MPAAFGGQAHACGAKQPRAGLDARRAELADRAYAMALVFGRIPPPQRALRAAQL